VSSLIAGRGGEQFPLNAFTTLDDSAGAKPKREIQLMKYGREEKPAVYSWISEEQQWNMDTGRRPNIWAAENPMYELKWRNSCKENWKKFTI
jgi:hypothetical protein